MLIIYVLYLTKTNVRLYGTHSNNKHICQIEAETDPENAHILLAQKFFVKEGGTMGEEKDKRELIPADDNKSSKPTQEMGQRIRQFRKEAGFSQKDISEAMNVTRNTVLNWEKGKYRPDPDLFPELCDFLGISLNDLFGIHPEERITPHERILIDQYRRISAGGQRIVDRMIHDMLDEELWQKEKMLDESITMLDQISTLAAAGNGYAFSDIPVEDYCFVFKDDRNKNANGIIRVKGKSMEPVYHEGDSVYVRYADSAEVGEDIICSSNEGIHIKRLGENGPYSLNKVFPFKPENEVKIVGKVLGIVSANDLPKKEDLSLLEQIRHGEIREFKEKHGTE